MLLDLKIVLWYKHITIALIVTTHPNITDAPESDYLYLGVSQLPNAGKGLFTAIPIYKDERVALFKGKILSQSQAILRATKGKDQYFISLLDGSILDSKNSPCFAKYANDAMGSNLTNFKNNTKIAFDDDGHLGIIATRHIKSGEELFCGYGKSYWKKHQISAKSF